MKLNLGLTLNSKIRQKTDSSSGIIFVETATYKYWVFTTDVENYYLGDDSEISDLNLLAVAGGGNGGGISGDLYCGGGGGGALFFAEKYPISIPTTITIVFSLPVQPNAMQVLLNSDPVFLYKGGRGGYPLEPVDDEKNGGSGGGAYSPDGNPGSANGGSEPEWGITYAQKGGDPSPKYAGGGGGVYPADTYMGGSGFSLSDLEAYFGIDEGGNIGGTTITTPGRNIHFGSGGSGWYLNEDTSPKWRIRYGQNAPSFSGCGGGGGGGLGAAGCVIICATKTSK